MNKTRGKIIQRYNFKLYISKKNLKFWDIIEDVRDAGILPSDYICRAVIDRYDQDMVLLKSLVEKQHKAQTTSEHLEYQEQIAQFVNSKGWKPPYDTNSKNKKPVVLEDIKAYQPDLTFLPPRELTDEEKETSEKIASGEWIVVTDEELANMKNEENNDEEIIIE